MGINHTLNRKKCSTIDCQKQIFQECQKFRTTIGKCNKSFGIEWFNWFTRGCCGDTSLILAKYLDEQGFGKIFMRWDDWMSVTWVARIE